MYHKVSIINSFFPFVQSLQPVQLWPLFNSFFLMFIYIWERGCKRGRVRERGRQKIRSRLCAGSGEPNAGLELVSCEIITWAEVGHSTPWTTQVFPFCFLILFIFSFSLPTIFLFSSDSSCKGIGFLESFFFSPKNQTLALIIFSVALWCVPFTLLITLIFYSSAFTGFLLLFFWIFNVFIYFWRRETETEHERGRSRERGRHRIWSRLQALSHQHRARRRARTHKLWDHDLSRSWTLNRLSHPDTSRSMDF